jgi:ZIP family zinc transporter
MDLTNIGFAFGLTLIAGLSTGIGGLLGLFAKRTNTKFLSIALGFSAGVMIYVSMIEIFSEAKVALIRSLGQRSGSWATVIAFFAGMLVIALIDKAIPSQSNPHEPKTMEDHEGGEIAVATEQNTVDNKSHSEGALMRTGVFTALAIAIHNFPEGMATFTAALQDSSLGVAIAVAIAIHNIPEGIAVGVPIFYATGKKSRGFWYALLSGVAEPIGALVAWLLLAQFISSTLFGVLFAAVAGIMVFISLDELLPAAREYGEHHLAIYGVVAGMIVMAVSLLLFM